MNTTAAALEAHVTVATVRTWCRLGAVAAVKTAGRWVIDAASLAHRIALGALKRPARKTAAVVGRGHWWQRASSRSATPPPATLQRSATRPAGRPGPKTNAAPPPTAPPRKITPPRRGVLPDG
ncbi:hypothetical protein [Streptomyces sp. Ac-502]|uniref:hypothetical protein n=1 Tax=Streptomyces sp. Ac-502 TaxID=3342801 RepID=UPI003862840E